MLLISFAVLVIAKGNWRQSSFGPAFSIMAESSSSFARELFLFLICSTTQTSICNSSTSSLLMRLPRMIFRPALIPPLPNMTEWLQQTLYCWNPSELRQTFVM